MPILVQRADFTAVKAQTFTKVLYTNQQDGTTITPYDLTGKTVSLQVVQQSDGTILYTLAASSQGLGYATFVFDEIDTNQDLLVNYQFLELLSPSGQNLLGYGTIDFVDIGTYVPYSDILEIETPPGITIPDNYKNAKTFEWRTLLKDSVNPPISDADLTNEAAWPYLYNVLIAKLVVYDFILRALKGMLATAGSSSSSTGTGGTTGNIKKIETGPSNVEFYDSLNSLSTFTKTDSSGGSALSSLATDICTIAKKLTVYLPICNNDTFTPILPIKGCRPNPCYDPMIILNNIN